MRRPAGAPKGTAQRALQGRLREFSKDGSESRPYRGRPYREPSLPRAVPVVSFMLSGQTAMSIARLLLLLVAMAPSAAFAQEDDASESIAFRWQTVTPAVLDGQGWTDTASPFDRFPGRASSDLRDPVWHLSRNSTGMSVRFTSDATHVRVRWTVTQDRLALPHMPATGVSGLDL